MFSVGTEVSIQQIKVMDEYQLRKEMGNDYLEDLGIDQNHYFYGLLVGYDPSRLDYEFGGLLYDDVKYNVILTPWYREYGRKIIYTPPQPLRVARRPSVSLSPIQSRSSSPVRSSVLTPVRSRSPSPIRSSVLTPVRSRSPVRSSVLSPRSSSVLTPVRSRSPSPIRSTRPSSVLTPVRSRSPGPVRDQSLFRRNRYE